VEGDFTNPQLRQRFSHMERVTGIEPALSAWEEFLPPVFPCPATILAASASLWWHLPVWSCGPCVARVWPVCGPCVARFSRFAC
jgi:hypothetical protein